MDSAVVAAEKLLPVAEKVKQVLAARGVEVDVAPRLEDRHDDVVTDSDALAHPAIEFVFCSRAL